MRLIIFALVAILARSTLAQFISGGWGGLIGSGGLNPFFSESQGPVLTCIAKNTNQDEMRLTITDQSSFWSPRPLDIDAAIKVSGQSQIRGRYSIVVTESGRVEDGCYHSALGEIIDTNFNFGPFAPNNGQPPTGIIADDIVLSPNNGQQFSGIVNGFRSLDQFNGAGVALCRQDLIRNRRCGEPLIQMCCKWGFDSAPATAPPSNINLATSMVSSVVSPMMTNVMNSGMSNGMNNGMNTGMNTLPGSTGGINTGGTGGTAPNLGGGLFP